MQVPFFFYASKMVRLKFFPLTFCTKTPRCHRPKLIAPERLTPKLMKENVMADVYGALWVRLEAKSSARNKRSRRLSRAADW